ncbi:leucyl/phenylalanyl-tRNA--protein transferase [Pseudogemmobacter humi]|uniref:Leucyl/phenylalanyl-tRNA--protein transferase n=1 Tax=Pseudogemmobacter humi TaxID=2483812 RepID=A0A3P5XNT9_9RHOB|nr:leucyl/phenylalanyl-tRNA--protein transferase [Pseudogemmobacter humi]VDC32026.1 Leucyl/phenylalanyl-tRNA--protein transferase [Pseudogemmobacter humi]
MTKVTPELLLHGYAAGVFPMAGSRDDPDIHWVDPRRRGVLPLDGFHISRSLARRIRRADWQITTDRAFRAVVEACSDRPETWINPEILDLYLGLAGMGFAHSLEVWEGEDLVGGVYGVTLGAAFFGESMFSRRRDASKLALAYLTHRLRAGGFRLFDTQFLTAHLASLGAVEISRAEYHRRLRRALDSEAAFDPPGYSADPSPVSSSGDSSVSGGV